MKRLPIQSLRALSICLSLIFVTYSQTKSPVVTGLGLDQVGAVIPGAEVNLREQGKNLILRKTTTNDDGKFSFSDVPTGEYDIEVRAGWISRSFRKQFKVSSSHPSKINFMISLEPCSDDAVPEKGDLLTENDRAAITRETLDLRFNFPLRSKANVGKVIFSDDNLQSDWLSSAQKEAIDIMSRMKIQAITEKSGELVYYSISKMTQRGSCVSLSINENWTVKGRYEDANMAGGGTTYEFRKVDGRWSGIVFTSWVV